MRRRHQQSTSGTTRAIPVVESLDGRRLFSVSYTVQDIGNLGGIGTYAKAINASGQIAGASALAAGGVHGFRTANAAIAASSDLGSLSRFSSFADGLNDTGQVAMISEDAGSIWHAYRTTATGKIGTAVALGVVAYPKTTLAAINASGQVVGQVVTRGNAGKTHALRTTAIGAIATASDLGAFGDDYSGPTRVNSVGLAINAAGQVTGYSEAGPASTRLHAFRTTATGGVTTATDLGVGNAFESVGTAINDTGQVAGYLVMSNLTTTHALRTSGTAAIGASSDLGTLGGTFAKAEGINASGEVVGQSKTSSGAQHAFVVMGNSSTMIDLNSVAALPAGVVLYEAVGVNASGQIACNGTINGQFHAFRLTPSVTAATHAIRGTLWNDANRNGRFDAGEAVSGAKTVFIDANGNNTLDAGERAVQSNAAGVYAFTGLADGTYHITRVFPAGFYLSNGVGSAKYVSVTVAGADKTGINLGSAATETPPVTASIGGTLWNDADKDGIFDAGESNSGAKTVFIDANANGHLDAGEISTQSDTAGQYKFSGLAAGTYKITRLFPSGYRLSNNTAGYLTITVAPGQSKTGVNLGSRTV